MSNQIHIIQNAITTTISEIFRGDFRRICEVKKAVLHLEAIYFCHGTCYLLKRENMPIKDQLALYQRIELIPQSTTEFFENNRECIINNWPEESALAAKPEILYDALCPMVYSPALATSNPRVSSMVRRSFSRTSACVLPSTFLVMRLPVIGSCPAV